MALTNHAKVQERPPAWASRGKLRIARISGGPLAEALSIYSGQWDGSPRSLLLSRRYTPALIDEVSAARVNALVLTWSAGFSREAEQSQWEILKELLPHLKKKKIKAIAEITLDCCCDELLRALPAAAEWLEHDGAGQVVLASGSGGRRLHMSLQHSGWREYLAKKVHDALEAGFKGILFDAVSRSKQAIELMNWLRSGVRAQGTADAEELLWSCYSWGAWPLVEFGNLVACPANTAPGFLREGLLQTNLGLLKSLFEAGGRDKPYVAAASGESAGPAESAEQKSRRLRQAEICATGGSWYDFALQDYRPFVAEHAELFAATDPLNSVGVLFSDEHAAVPRCEPLATQLARCNIQYDVIPARGLQRFDLRKYKVLCAFDLQCATDSMLEALSVYAAGGGTLLASDSTGSLGEGQQPRHRPEWLSLPVVVPRHERPIGEGRVILYGDSTRGGEADVGSILKQPLEDILRYGGESPILVEAPDGVIALLWGKGTRRWVHLINYRSEACEALITLPGCGGRQLVLYSPDSPAGDLRVLESGSARAVFSVSGLQTYAIVEIV